MATFLTIGPLTVVVEVDGASHGAATLVGELTENFDGSTFISSRGQKRHMRVPLAPIDNTTLAALKSIIGGGAGMTPVPCSGLFLNNIGGTFRVSISGETPMPAPVNGPLWRVALQLDETVPITSVLV